MSKIKPILDSAKALALVRDVLGKLHRRGDALAWRDDHILMATRLGRVLTLSGAERDGFYRMLTALGRATYHLPIGEASLRAAFEDAIFLSLASSPEEFPAALESAIKGLRKTMMATPERWRMAYRIQWIEESELPFTYRDVRFVKATHTDVKA